jgi:hypothetical protein
VDAWAPAGNKHPSVAFCVLYRMMLMRLTRKQVGQLLNAPDAPLLRALGLLYLRYTHPPGDLWPWFEPFMDDEATVFSPGMNQMQRTSMAEYAKGLLTEPRYYGTLLPRLPVKVHEDVQVKLLLAEKDRARARANAGRAHLFFKGAKVRARFHEDEKWYPATVDGPDEASGTLGGGKPGVSATRRYWVTYDEFGDSESVALGRLEPLTGGSAAGAGGSAEDDARFRQRDSEFDRIRSAGGGGGGGGGRRDDDDDNGRGGGGGGGRDFGRGGGGGSSSYRNDGGRRDGGGGDDRGGYAGSANARGSRGGDDDGYRGGWRSRSRSRDRSTGGGGGSGSYSRGGGGGGGGGAAYDPFDYRGGRRQDSSSGGGRGYRDDDRGRRNDDRYDTRRDDDRYRREDDRYRRDDDRDRRYGDDRRGGGGYRDDDRDYRSGSGRGGGTSAAAASDDTDDVDALRAQVRQRERAAAVASGKDYAVRPSGISSALTAGSTRYDPPPRGGGDGRSASRSGSVDRSGFDATGSSSSSSAAAAAGAPAQQPAPAPVAAAPPPPPSAEALARMRELQARYGDGAGGGSGGGGGASLRVGAARDGDEDVVQVGSWGH